MISFIFLEFLEIFKNYLYRALKTILLIHFFYGLKVSIVHCRSPNLHWGDCPWTNDWLHSQSSRTYVSDHEKALINSRLGNIQLTLNHKPSLIVINGCSFVAALPLSEIDHFVHYHFRFYLFPFQRVFNVLNFLLVRNRSGSTAKL